MQWIDARNAFRFRIDYKHLAGRHSHEIGMGDEDSRAIAEAKHERFRTAVQSVSDQLGVHFVQAHESQWVG